MALTLPRASLTDPAVSGIVIEITNKKAHRHAHDTTKPITKGILSYNLNSIPINLNDMAGQVKQKRLRLCEYATGGRQDKGRA
jgi:hypothetical protein